MGKFTKVVDELREEIKASPEKKLRMQFRTFLRRMGLTNRVKDSLKRVQISLSKSGIIFEFSNHSADVDRLHEYPTTGYITFRLKGVRRPRKTVDPPNDKKAKVKWAGTIQVTPGECDRPLFRHQKDAIRSLNKKIIVPNPSPFAGLLAIPTGGGKTKTAAWWSLSNLIGRTKLLWIAHRHELLAQAAEAFKDNAFSDVMGTRKSFTYRIVSGIHDKPVHIKSSDDLIIASKDSLQQSLDRVVRTLKLGESPADGIFLIVDEAHHATAKSYRAIIDTLRSKFKKFQILGLTATPWRTAENERGLLKKVFPDDIIYKINMKTLMARGILAKPKFRELRTQIDMTEIVSEKDLENIRHFDIDTIGKDSAKMLAENKTRNRFIVDHYLGHEREYGQTLVFALNVLNAIALDALFKKNGVRSDFVVGEIRDPFTGVKFSPKENQEKIRLFREKEIAVLINVNILTEGVDIPGVETVFLTRPTISTGLMTQMIGRGLRGEEVGGKRSVNVVSFIDEWRDKIAWVNPERLYIEENVDFKDKTSETQRQIVRLVSIEKISEFARILDRTVDDGILALDFIQRVPVGIYSFEYLDEFSGQSEAPEKRCEVLVYDNMSTAYKKFVNDISSILSDEVLPRKPQHMDFVKLGRRVEEEYFTEVEKYPGYSSEDIWDILKFYYQHSTCPTFVEFKDRAKFDINKVAHEVKEMKHAQKMDHLKKVWSEEHNEWKTFFGYDIRYFIEEVELALRRCHDPEIWARKAVPKPVIDELRPLDLLTMDQIRDVDVEHWQKLHDEVFGRHRDKDGCYVCAKTGFRSKQKVHFHIDHIKPYASGGLTVLDNLQLLHIRENLRKGNR